MTDYNLLKTLLTKVPEGPRIEFGVHKGRALKEIEKHKEKTYGVDTFEGMPEPTEKDYDHLGTNFYPKGRLSWPKSKVESKHSYLIKGTVPAILDKVPNIKYAFCHIDMDQYLSTFKTLEFMWDKMLDNGIILCDDYFADRDYLAGGAINEWARLVNINPQTKNKMAWWIF